MALIHTGGFVLAGMALFACVARGFGSTRVVRDLVIGLVLGLVVFLFFVQDSSTWACRRAGSSRSWAARRSAAGPTP